MEQPPPQEPVPVQPLDEPPPRAFMQGVGTVFQFVGTGLFLVMMFVCCASALISKDYSVRHDWGEIGWGDARQGGRKLYSAQTAVTVALPASIFFGMALAGLGLGLQAQRRKAPTWAGILTGFALAFWVVHTIFAAAAMRSVAFTLIGLLLTLLFAALFVLALGAIRDVRRDPPPADLDVLPENYQTPYSHLDQDPPEVRLARELEQRRRKLQVEQKELEAMERRLKRKMDQK